MPRPSRTALRSAPYTALVAAFTLLLALLVPVLSTGVAVAAGQPAAPQAAPTADATPAVRPKPAVKPKAEAEPAPRAADAPAAADCAPLTLAPYGDPGTAVAKASLAGNGTACFTFTAERPGLHRVLRLGHYDTYVYVFDKDGTALDCYDYDWGAGWCDLPSAGTYTVRLDNQSVDPDESSLTVTPLTGTEGCLPEVGTSWDQAPLTGKVQPLGVFCRPFKGAPGERVTFDYHLVEYGDERGWITDATGRVICDPRAQGVGCVLPGTGPYRFLGEASDARTEARDYELTIRRLSDPEGCGTVPVNAYGSAPTAVTPVTGCKTLTVPADGTYDVYDVAEEGQRTRLQVFDREGATVCETWAACELKTGVRYTLTTARPTLILDRAATDGCRTVTPGAVTGTFAVPGEIDCLLLDLPENARVALPADLGGTGPRPELQVVKPDGGYLCGEENLFAGTCALTGPGPYRVLVSTDDQEPSTGEYRTHLYRTDAANACAVFPAGDFTATGAVARPTTGAGVFSSCLTIPADAHSAQENVQITADAGAPAASFSILDTTGKQICSGGSSYGSWTTCALTPGLAHTVLLVGRGTPAAYTLARRDVTETAKGCVATPATPVGGPSATGTMAGAGVLVCRQVTTGDAADVLHLDVRDANGTANVLAYGATGDAVATCGYRNRSCQVTGSTRYQVMVFVPANLKAAGTYRFDALRIGTKSGPAPECERVPNIAYGHGPITGRLDEAHTATCLVLPTAARDRFDVKTTDTQGRADIAVPALYDASGDNNCYAWGQGTYQCYLQEPGQRNPSPSTFVLSLPEKASVTDYSTLLACWSSLCGTEEISVGTVSPASAQGGKVATLTVTGTSLRMKDYVRLSSGGKTLKATTVSVSPDARTLTASLDLTGVGESSWSVSVIINDGYEYPRGSFSVTKPAAGLGTFKPVTPTRIMNTIDGTGVRKGKVGPGGTVVLQVAGRGGVPATGVSAVVMNVTATAPTAASFVSVYPDGTARTSASNLNFKAGQSVPNLVVVPVVNGKVAFYNKSGSVDLLADVAGYYVTDGSGATYRPITPTRIMNTLDGTGVRKGKVGPGGTVVLPVAGRGGVPATGVTAVVMNVTAVGPTAASFVSVYPDGTARTSASNLNFVAGQTVPNLVVVPVVNGKVAFYNKSGSVDLLADVAGYFTSDGTGSAYKPITPTRLMNTIAGQGVRQGKVGPRGTVVLPVAGQAGIPLTGVTAVVMNVTAVGPTAASFVSVYPDGTARTSASNLNFVTGQTVPNLVVVPVVNGKVSFYNHAGSVDLLADVAGYYVS
ncbi:hypothetical protein [Streptomyces sp. NPDC090025]|uniref:hypothetical protein n=1 Tax=Streptomyces sp. NPDC090025 TaxID=3365922 RepID=UPI0038376B59